VRSGGKGGMGVAFKKLTVRVGALTALNTGYALRRCAPRPSAHWPTLRYGQRRIAWERCTQWQQNFGRASVPGIVKNDFCL